MGLFVAIFGSDNTMVGVMILVTLLMMLGQDLSQKPVSSLIGMILLNISIVVVCYLTTASSVLGIFLIFGLIFLIIYLMMHDLKSPLYFPFILGYMLIMSTPVPLSALPLRILSVVVGSIVIIGINILLNKNKLKTQTHKGINGLLTEIKNCIAEKIKGEKVSEEVLISNIKIIKSAIYDRLEENYYTSPKNRSIMNLTIAIEQIGLAVCRNNYDYNNLKDLDKLIDDLIEHETYHQETNENTKLNSVLEEINKFISSHQSIGYGILSNLKIIHYELNYLSEEPNEEIVRESKIPREFRIKTIFKENFNKDSVKFTFAFRLAVVVAFWEFIGIYFNIPDARWLACTSLAIILPYKENVISKSKYRIIGTTIGLIIFSILALAFLGNFNLFNYSLGTHLNTANTTVILIMIISYVYTLVKPERYDIDTIFITLQAVFYSFSMYPANMSMILRFLFVGLGIVVAVPANFIIMPYTLIKEDLNMCKKQMKLNMEQINNLKEALSGDVDDVKNAVIILKTSLISDKIEVNNQQDENEDIDTILKNQNEITAQCTLLRNTLRVDNLSNNVKILAIDLLDDFNKNNWDIEKVDHLVKDFNKNERIYLEIVQNMLNICDETRLMLTNLSKDIS